MEWTDETIARLKALWQEGLSTAEIGRQLGITKNAVVGKAHRLGLPARPSPIRRQDGKTSARKTGEADGQVKAAAPRRSGKEEGLAEPAEAVAAAQPVAVAASMTTGDVATAVVRKPVEKPVVTCSEDTESALVKQASVAVQEKPAEERVKAVVPAVVKAVQEEPAAEKAASVEKKASPVARPAAQRLAAVMEPRRRSATCCWPLGDPGTPGFHFCGATPLPGKPYCAEHAALAYVKLRDRRENVG
ncbi:GcrA family cell cycle regulator [Acetobacter sp.]|jgi:GcrA cell cycle regulator|uniref:GcrA family cell cycle regulator n=1 Tax=Acetobacter sp. TaxID=440 RepID=UPI0025C6020F|nr:GcrA family cell cycle regulator [Acetobacter sp.]MCH4091494.1 GcrA family cell cycle regulator [Acetobacter sp.]MCI1299472.1 GcrA family cell cycle regulator [Acetobacter sp.]MCI1316938.1 GcrA family cell cycle regulator [Acetobacter sp.]